MVGFTAFGKGKDMIIAQGKGGETEIYFSKVLIRTV